MPYTHPYDPAQDNRPDLATEPGFPKFSITGPSWQDAFYRDLLAQTERLISDYCRAVADPSKDLEKPREAMRQGFLGNALKIVQTIERGYVAEEDWQAFKKERES